MSDPQSYRDGPYRPWPGAFAPWTPWTLMMEPWLQCLRLWSDGLAMWGGRGGSANPLSSLMGMGGHPGVSVEVTSARATGVTLDLAPGADFQTLRVGRLRKTTDSDTDALEGVEIIARPGLYTVRLEVPDTQAPGLYVAPVENQWGQALGDLRVEIKGAADGSKSDGKAASKKSGSKK